MDDMALIEIREATRDEIPLLVSFNQSMALETENLELDRATLASGVKGVFDRPERGTYFVAEVGGRVVGGLMVTKEWSDWRNGDFWWIQSVYVIPEFRRRGVFGALYANARSRAEMDPAVCGCRLYVEKENVSAQEVYLQKGFSETDYRLFEDCF